LPVTAKLSRKCCEPFGDEIANELAEWFNAVDTTYRSELREINEKRGWRSSKPAWSAGWASCSRACRAG
jgi:hypothetical protein